MSSIRMWVYCPRCRATYPDGYRHCPRDREALETTTVDPLIGSILDHRYRVEEVVGEGLLGRVYRAQNIRIPRCCAIKVASSRSSIQHRAALRLLNEAEAGALMDHPNVVAVLDLGETVGGQPYLVMEFADGETLGAHLARHTRLAVHSALALSQQLALGLEHAHGHGLVHRDLTPENVVVGARGRARILDFGLALLLDGDAKRLTDTGMVIGTPTYMAPEQAAGEPIDARADLYSLGVLMFQMLAGCLPFDGPPTYDRPPHLGDRVAGLFFDRPIDDLIHRMLAPRRSERIGDATSVVSELEMLIATTGARTAPSWLPAPDAQPAEWPDIPTARITPPRALTLSSPEESQPPSNGQRS